MILVNIHQKLKKIFAGNYVDTIAEYWPRIRSHNQMRVFVNTCALTDWLNAIGFLDCTFNYPVPKYVEFIGDADTKQLAWKFLRGIFLQINGALDWRVTRYIDGGSLLKTLKNPDARRIFSQDYFDVPGFVWSNILLKNIGDLPLYNADIRGIVALNNVLRVDLDKSSAALCVGFMRECGITKKDIVKYTPNVGELLHYLERPTRTKYPQIYGTNSVE